MSVYDRLFALAAPVTTAPAPTGYFAPASDHLDPSLFEGDHLRPAVRRDLLQSLYLFWASRYHAINDWSRVWVAGSGVSYQWQGSDGAPGDLDVLIGVDWPKFRQANPDFRGLGDEEIAEVLNQELHNDLWPITSNFLGRYETTYFVNPHSKSIENIHPYAAYSLTEDRWVVRPDKHPKPPSLPEYDLIVNQDTERANQILSRYNTSLDEVSATSNPGMRLNSEITLRTSAHEGAMLFDEIHEGRKRAFSSFGQGYEDLAEYRYKSAKASGHLGALRTLKVELINAGLADEDGTYGFEIPSAHHSLVMSALSRRYSG